MRKRVISLAALLLAGTICLASDAVVARATTVLVDCSLGADLQAAIDAASPGDTLAISGTCLGNGPDPGSFVITKSLTLLGISAGTTLDGGRAGRVVFVTGADPVVEIGNLTITGGTSAGCGAGLLNISGSVTLTNVAVRDNHAAGFGGGLCTIASLAVLNSTVSGNVAHGGGPNTIGFGGGIEVEGVSFTMVNSTVSGNVAGDLTASNAGGGGISVHGGASTITHSTITDNAALGGNATGGGIQANHGTVAIRASIVAANQASSDGADCFGGALLVSQGSNLIGTHANCIAAPSATDLLGAASSPIDPLLGPLADNGGSTETHALLTGSPAIDAVGSACPPPTTDQRGVGRPHGAACDIGAYELEAPTIVEIDIKPGSDPNSIQLGSQGTVPVAIFSSASFDARTVDPVSVTLAGAQVRLKGKGTPMSSLADLNGDGLLDLIVHVDTEALQLSSGDTEAVLTGQTSGGTAISGVDSVRIVQ